MEWIIVLPMLIFVSLGFLLLDKHDWDKKLLADKWGVWGVISLLLVLIYPLALFYWAMILIVGYDI